VFKKIRWTILKGAVAPAKRSPKGLMTVLSNDILSAITGYIFGSPVEKQDASLQVVGKNPL